MNKNQDGLTESNRKTARRIQRYWLDAALRLNRRTQRAHEEMGASRANFLSAVARCKQGHPKELAKYLRSDQHLSPMHRHYLASLLENTIGQRAKRGRPYSDDLHAAANVALSVYKTWREENRRLGIKDHGQGLAMKDEAARFIIEELEPMDIELEAVRHLMDRSKRRRK